MRITSGWWLWLAMASAVPAFADTTSPLLQPVGPHPAVTTHLKGRFNGAKLKYTARVEALDVSDANGRSSIVSFSYTRDGVKDAARRPVTFLFNGGPIAPSAWVHLGGLGPFRVDIPDEVGADPGAFHIIGNEYSPLDATDLVFVDPASTGWSRVAGGSKPEAWFSIRADAQQFVAFIQAWLAAHGRSGSPVYVFGESYGTNRAAEIAGQVAETPAAFHLAGVFLYGQAVNIIEYAQRPANITSYAVSLPTLAAIAWYHGRIDRGGKTRDAFEAREFACREQVPARCSRAPGCPRPTSSASRPGWSSTAASRRRGTSRMRCASPRKNSAGTAEGPRPAVGPQRCALHRAAGTQGPRRGPIRRAAAHRREAV
ncbi:MAG: hypothetical protein U1F35_05720 [Steroidobacteraceae bacterium]